MVPEIGVMIGLYILARLVPPRWRGVAATLAVLAALAAVFTIADLIVRGTAGHALLAKKEAVPVAPPAKTATGETAKATSTRADGGRITTELGYGLAVAKNSTLHREFIAVHDPALPLELVGTPGVITAWKSGESQYERGEYRYRAPFTVKAARPVQAFEVRFVTFDVWGNDVRPLSYQEVRDLGAGEQRDVSGEWRVFSEQDVENHYASIAYVARVRLADGTVLVADTEPVVAEAKRFNAKFTGEELEPEEKPKADT